jgi:hypothetical protein
MTASTFGVNTNGQAMSLIPPNPPDLMRMYGQSLQERYPRSRFASARRPNLTTRQPLASPALVRGGGVGRRVKSPNRTGEAVGDQRRLAIGQAALNDSFVEVRV